MSVLVVNRHFLFIQSILRVYMYMRITCCIQAPLPAYSTISPKEQLLCAELQEELIKSVEGCLDLDGSTMIQWSSGIKQPKLSVEPQFLNQFAHEAQYLRSEQNANNLSKAEVEHNLNNFARLWHPAQHAVLNPKP